MDSTMRTNLASRWKGVRLPGASGKSAPQSSPNFPSDFPGSSLTAELNSNPEVPQKFLGEPLRYLIRHFSTRLATVRALW